MSSHAVIQQQRRTSAADRPRRSPCKRSPKRIRLGPRSSPGRSRTRSVKLDPRHLWRNPVMFVVEIGAVDHDASSADRRSRRRRRCRACSFSASITLWLWFTVLFANFAEAMAEGRGKAQADTLRKTRTDTIGASRVDPNGASTRRSPRRTCAPGDIVLVEAGDIDPRRRRGHRGRRLRRRGGDHRRVGAGAQGAGHATSAARSPAARRSSPTGCASASPPTRARRSSTA